MNIPQKYYDILEGLSFTEHANFLAIITYYMEYGVIHDEGRGYALELFYDIRDELDDILRRRRYARAYRARKKARQQSEAIEKSETSEKPDDSGRSDTSDIPENTDSPEEMPSAPVLNRRQRRQIEFKRRRRLRKAAKATVRIRA